MERSLLRRCPNCGINVKDDTNDSKVNEEKKLSGLPKDLYDFASKSTLHGLRNVSDDSRNHLRRYQVNHLSTIFFQNHINKYTV